MRILYSIMLVLLTVTAFGSGGSVYTRYGIGDVKLYSTAAEAGFGGTGLSLLRSDNLSFSNPATWSAINITRFNASFSFTGYDISDHSSSAFYSETDFSGFMVGFPISNDYGISLVGGLVPYSNVNYEIFSEESEPEIGNYNVTYSGEGGLSRAFIGVSYKLPFDVLLGASYEYYNGKTDFATELNFDQTTDFSNSQYELSLKSHGIGYTFGLVSPDIAKQLNFEKLSNLRLGVTYHFLPPLDVDSVLSSDNSVGFQSLTNRGFEREIPDRLGLGVSFTWDENYTVMFDYVNQNFAEYSAGGQKSSFLRDLNRFSLGFEYRHNSGRFGTAWEQMVFRAGLSFEETPYLINGEGINEMAVYGGFSFPMGVDNSMDFGFKYGIRGSNENNLIKENIFAAYMSLSFGDLWFVRPDR